jgi:hypothetical protein
MFIDLTAIPNTMQVSEVNRGFWWSIFEDRQRKNAPVY